LHSKTMMLLNHDLVGLEQSVAIEAVLCDQLGSQQTSLTKKSLCQDRNDVEPPIDNQLRYLLKELHAVNVKNAPLVRSGLEFVETLMEELLPSQTYTHSLRRNIKPPESKFRVTC
jgi:hypothetical protein